jgi:GH15 family glucan-1,4-alpha-glucosidase
MTNNGYKPIRDYAVIGNLRTVALIGLDGSIDWCCLPDLDSPSVFAALLDRRRGGRFLVAPAGAGYGEQRYIEDTNVLETVFQFDGGRLVVTDFMPLWGRIEEIDGSRAPDEINRILRCEGAPVEVEVEWSPRPDYARAQVEVDSIPSGWSVQAGKLPLVLAGLGEGWLVETETGPTVKGRIRLEPGQERLLVTRWVEGPVEADLGAARQKLKRTIGSWHDWVRQEPAAKARQWAGERLPLVIRSELALKLLAHADTGAIAAAATTSLPEWIGGDRNWDYRYAWIRDAAFTVQALGALGHETEALDFLYWAERISQGHEREVQIMYGIRGQDTLDEFELPHLEGYRASGPVRIGNGAAGQIQLDVFGELLDSAYELLRRGHRLERRLMAFLSRMADQAAETWQEPDYGIWEVRNGPKHFVYSKVMVWLALHRAVHLADWYGLEGDVATWRRTRGDIADAVLKHGYDERIGSFVQSFGSTDLDASNLLIPFHEFLPFEDPRVQGTIDRTIEQLEENGLVYRYRNDDGLAGEEGAFGLCTFWLVDALAMSGRLTEARRIFEGLVNRANHVGLFPEQIDPKTGEFLGNFPQAFTHIGLINSMLFLADAEGRRTGQPPLIGTKQHRHEYGAKRKNKEGLR